MFNVFWLDANWKKLLWILNLILGVTVLALSYVDIYSANISPIVSVFRLFQFILILGSVYGIVKDKNVQEKILKNVMSHPLILALTKSDVENFKRELKSNHSALNISFSNGDSLLRGAGIFGSSRLAELLIKEGAKVLELTRPGISPLFDAAKSGAHDAYNIIRASLNENDFKAMCTKSEISELYFAAYEGNVEVVKKIATHANAMGNIKGITPLHMAILGKRDRTVIQILVELGADPNSLAPIAIKKESVDLIQPQDFSPSMLSVLFKDEELALFFFARNPKMIASDGDMDHVMIACMLGLGKYVDAVVSDYEWKRRDRHGRTALDYAKQSGHQNLVQKITQSLNSQSTTKSSQSSTQNNSKNYNIANSNLQQQISKEQVETNIAMSLEGLVGFDNFIDNFSHDLVDFLKKQPGESKGIVVWGDASVGKSELGQRLAGLKQDFNIPSLNLSGVEVRYIACCDTQIDISKEVSEAAPKSIIILDEVDKFFNPKSGIVNESEAKKLRTSIVTNFQNKPIFWIFMGTFHDLRGQNELKERELSQVLGTELTSRLDFADWKLPSWTLESLLTAGQYFLNRDAESVTYDDEAMVILVNQALGSGGGVRQLQKYHDYFKRQAGKKGSQLQVDKAQADAYLKMLNVT